MDNMTILGIHIDAETEPYLSQDQMFIHSPIVFPTIQFELLDTIELNAEADRIRIAEGKRPCYCRNANAGTGYDPDGYYRFFIALYGVWPGCENCVTFHYVDEWGKETGEYQIDLTDEQRTMLFALINRECVEHFCENAVSLMLDYAKDNGLGWRGMMYE